MCKVRELCSQDSLCSSLTQALTVHAMNATPAMKDQMIEKLEGYLSGSMSHEDIREFAWNLADESPAEPAEHEKVYWSSVFSIIHLADEDHWIDGCTKRDLGRLCEQLKRAQSS